MGSRKNLYLTPSFSLNLGSGIDSGLVCVGKFDGIHPSLVCATEGGKIMIHSPHEKTTLSPENKETKYLSLNRIPTALTTCRIDDRSSAEILIIGTQTNLLVYNVHTNTDVFYKDIPEGVHALCSGKMGHNDSTWIIVGGSCSIQGFDLQGNEVYWSVTGDNVTAMTFSDYNKDGANELIVSSQDYVIRIFSGEEVICEIPTVDSVLQLRSHVNGFVYALGNGTFGSYLDSVKKWRVKSKNKVTTITSHDINEDGVDEIFIGFEDGSFEVYHPFSGALLHKDRLNAPITGIVVADFRQSGRNEIVVCTKDGTLTGFGIGQPSAQIGGDLERKKMSELMQTKQSLHHELTALEEEMRRLRVGEKSELSSESTKLDCKLRPNLDCHSIDLCASVKDGAVIRCLIIHGNMIFGTKEHGVYFSQDPQKTMIARLKPEKDVSTRLEIKALVGIKHAKSHLVLESHYTLPKFCMYVSVNEMLSEPEGNLSFVLSEHSARVIGWMNNNFSSNIDSKASSFKLSFVSLRDSSYLIIQMFQQGTGMNSSTAVTISVNSIEVAGDIVQDLVASLSISELESVADFPQEFTEFEKVLMKVDEYNSVRMKLTAEMADSSQLVKALVIKAEDARILSDMRYMKRMYSNLYDVNRELIGEYIKRSNNHNELLAALKDVNIMIQKAARLRVGAPKTVVVNECRSAIKSNNVHALFHVMKHGRLP